MPQTAGACEHSRASEGSEEGAQERDFDGPFTSPSGVVMMPKISVRAAIEGKNLGRPEQPHAPVGDQFVAALQLPKVPSDSLQHEQNPSLASRSLLPGHMLHGPALPYHTQRGLCP